MGYKPLSVQCLTRPGMPIKQIGYSYRRIIEFIVA